MASITIRRLDEGTKAKLRLRAAQHGRSMEEEARELLRAGVREQRTPAKLNFAESIRRHFELIGGVELTIPERQPVRRPPNFRGK